MRYVGCIYVKAYINVQIDYTKGRVFYLRYDAYVEANHKQGIQMEEQVSLHKEDCRVVPGGEKKYLADMIGNNVSGTWWTSMLCEIMDF